MRARETAVTTKRTSLPLPLFWAALLIGGGVVVWGLVPRQRSSIPEVWKETTGEADSQRALASVVRSPGEGGRLLRMEWPAHPRAESYLVRFLSPHGTSSTPVPVRGTVFLYDLESDVLHLPSEFEWEVTAVLADGSHAVTPARRFP